jgi:phospholipase D1/2
VPPEALIDPEKPVEPDECVGQFVPVETPRRLIGGFALLAMAIVGFAAAWHWTPLGRYAQSKALTQVAQCIDVLAIAPAYVLTAVISVAITLLTTSTGLVFDAAWGSFYALAGRSLRLRSAV